MELTTLLFLGFFAAVALLNYTLPRVLRPYCLLVQRSGDMGLGVPFNMAQYAALVCMIAQVSGLRPGLFTHVINNAHVYENHKEQLLLQLSRLPQAYDAPKLVLNSDIKNFYDFKPEDIVLKNYKHHDKIAMEVSV